MAYAIAAFFAFLFAGTAFAYLVGGAAVVAFVAAGYQDYIAIFPQRIFSQLNVFVFMAMPLFILTGEIMNRAGVMSAMIDFAMALVGRLKGGLGHVNIMTSLFFSGISGSAVADSAAVSNSLIPAMRERGYSPYYAGAITAASSMIGPIIPPSIIMIVYGGLTSTSVAALFVAGILPGLLLAVLLFGLNGWMARRNNHPGGSGVEVPPLLASFKRAAPALSIPLIILGSIAFGVATPTEGAAIAVVAATIVGCLTGGMSLKVFYQAMEATARMTGSIFIIICSIAVLSFLAGLLGWPQLLAGWIEDIGLTGPYYLLLLVAVLLVSGMFMDTPVALTLLVPLLVPTAFMQGINPVHLGIMICFNLCIGLITPPLGKCLIVVAGVANINYWRLAMATLPFLGVQVVTLLFISFVPEISLILPRFFGFKVD
ncbi:TRAP transporter large permease [uncultured Marinobacter sp.]|uniref:TRAP transporter large permease n=1 Tax=uncultured Marinobacter sp. TaxID=187379 RepID=UPI0025FF257F|nr:TRAP transporter large permease [uncultured Marinobacter sp.]